MRKQAGESGACLVPRLGWQRSAADTLAAGPSSPFPFPPVLLLTLATAAAGSGREAGPVHWRSADGRAIGNRRGDLRRQAKASWSRKNLKNGKTGRKGGREETRLAGKQSPVGIQLLNKPLFRKCVKYGQQSVFSLGGYRWGEEAGGDE